MQRLLSVALLVVSVMLIITSWKLISKNNKGQTVKIVTNCHDTLYIIEETRIEKCSNAMQDFKDTTIEESQPDVLFKDGKTRDTIRRTTTEYY
jgi:hypothetical protein